MNPPNILFLNTDQQRLDTLGILNPAARTPNLDRLAQQGVLFEAASCNAPVCMPSRHSFFSGRYPSSLGNTRNGIELDPGVKLFHQDLAEAGYWTASVGKLHFLNHATRDHRIAHPSWGFDLMVNSDEPGCYEDDYIRWVQNRNPEAVEACRCSTPPECRMPPLELDPRNTHEPYVFRGPEDCTHSAFVARRGIQAIEEAPPDRPWFVNLGFYAPHAPVNPPRRFWEEAMKHDLAFPNWPEEWEEVLGNEREEWKSIVAAYHGLTTHVDEEIGRVMRFLEQRGELESTLILFCSDHGEYLGDFGRVQKGPPGHDVIMQVPLIVHWPEGMPRSGVRVSAPTELVDIAPTLVEAGTGAVPDRFQGRSLLSWGGEEQPDWPRDSAFQEFYKDGYGTDTVRMGAYTYVCDSTGRETLWNRAREEGEWSSVAEDPEEQEMLETCRSELMRRIPEDRRPPREVTGPY